MKLILAFLLLGAAAFGQNVAVLTHGSANSEEYKNGCPTNWPASVVDLGSSTNLPASCSATNGWVVWSTNKLETTKAALTALKETWNKVWIEKNGPGKSWDAMEFIDRVESIAPGAWDRLDNAIANTDIPSEVRAQLRVARRKVQTAREIQSRNEDTVRFFDAAVLLGIVTAEQRDQILTGS